MVNEATRRFMVVCRSLALDYAEGTHSARHLSLWVSGRVG
jgi:hypothetical protein